MCLFQSLWQAKAYYNEMKKKAVKEVEDAKEEEDQARGARSIANPEPWPKSRTTHRTYTTEVD